MNKKDFAIIFSVKNANPNGDPLNGNRPRQDLNGYGEVTDVCIKRKIRNRLMDNGLSLFVQSENNNVDGFNNLKERFEANIDVRNFESPEAIRQAVCQKWFDVRGFGQVFTFKGDKKSDSVVLGIRGPISMHSAYSVNPICITSKQITKSVNLKPSDTLTSDRMGMKHTVDYGLYVCFGSINTQLAERTGFTEDDVALFKSVLPSLFENDMSSARPEGSMEVNQVIWWEHQCPTGNYSAAKVHKSLEITTKETAPTQFKDFDITIHELPEVTVEVIEGY